MIAAIMQPTYLPWMGYFGMIDAADIFVFYNDVQFEKQSWQQRNKIKSPNGEWMWLSVPTIHNHRQEIRDVQICNGIDWRNIHWQSICHAYGKSPFFNDFKGELNKLYRHDWKYICDLNSHTIAMLAGLLEIRSPKFLYSSDLTNITGRKTDRICQILEQIGCDELIAGPGTKNYLEIDKLKEKGVIVYWFEFQNPAYPQFKGEFIEYLSAIDLLFNTGKQALNYIRQGSETALKLDRSYLKCCKRQICLKGT